MEDLMPHAIREYDKSLARYGTMNSRASGQIGFVGIIIAIFSFSFGQVSAVQWSVGLLIVGLSVLTFSIILSIINLITRDIGVIDVNRYLKDQKDELDTKSLIEDYMASVICLDKKNESKAQVLNASYVLTIVGLTISFSASIFSIM
jgi:hypothetical protein